MKRYFKGSHGITYHAYLILLVWVIQGFKNDHARGMTKLDLANALIGLDRLIAAAVVLIGRHRV